MSDTILLSKLRKSISDEEPLLVRLAVQSLWKSDAKKHELKLRGDSLCWFGASWQPLFVFCFKRERENKLDSAVVITNHWSVVQKKAIGWLQNYKSSNKWQDLGNQRSQDATKTWLETENKLMTVTKWGKFPRQIELKQIKSSSQLNTSTENCNQCESLLR